MDAKLDHYEILSRNYKPLHWPKTSIYRFESIRARVLKKCRGVKVKDNELNSFVNKIVKDVLETKHGFPAKRRTVNTYRSVLLRYIVETILNKPLKPWEATRFIKTTKAKYNESK